MGELAEIGADIRYQFLFILMIYLPIKIDFLFVSYLFHQQQFHSQMAYLCEFTNFVLILFFFLEYSLKSGLLMQDSGGYCV